MSRLAVAQWAVTSSIFLWSAVGAPGAQAAPAPNGKSQLSFGVDMAKRGLWSEALFRFEQAKLQQPGSVSVLNNLAICYEAGGRFEEAMATYREALRLAPENRVLKQNYTRFAEFYQGFRAKKPAAPAAPAAAPAPPVAPGGADSAAPVPDPARPPLEAPPAAPGAPDAPPPSPAALSEGGRS